MKLKQLKYIWEVSRHNLNVTATAESLFTSQPGISHQIKLLEDELDIQIFERSGKKLTAVSPAGNAILEHVTDLLNNAKNIKQAARDFSNHKRGSLTIATTHTQAQFILPSILQRFAHRYPHIELRVHQGNPKSMCKLAANNQVDFVIASEVIDERGELVTLPAYRWNRFIVVPKDHELTRVKEVTLPLLTEYPILTDMLGLPTDFMIQRTTERSKSRSTRLWLVSTLIPLTSLRKLLQKFATDQLCRPLWFAEVLNIKHLAGTETRYPVPLRHKKKRPYGRSFFENEDAGQVCWSHFSGSYPVRFPDGQVPVSEPEPVLDIGLPKA